MKSKKSQVTVFIIIGIIIIAGIVFYFLVINKKIPIITQPIMSDPQSYIGKCAKDAADEAIEIMLPQGGYISPRNYKLYQDDKVGYLCYTPDYYKPCLNQEPMIIENAQNEITKYISDKVNTCFQELKTEMQQDKYTVEMGEMKIETYIATGIVRISIERKFEMTRNEESKDFDKFYSAFNSPLYDLLKIALRISNGEASNCDYDYVSHEMLNPDWDIKKFVSGDSIRIYAIKDKYTEKELNIAVRSCVIPPGL